jgi:hypothetical protein
MPHSQPSRQKQKHRVHDVAGPSGYDELVRRLVGVLADDDDPSVVWVMGFLEDIDSEDSAIYLRNRIVAAGLDERHLDRLHLVSRAGEEDAAKGPYSLGGEMWADELVRMMREPNGGFDAEGKDHLRVMASRQDQHRLRPRTIVSLWRSEKYLDYFLGKLQQPVEFFSVGAHEPGLRARPGYGEPEAQGPIFTPLGEWDVEPVREIVDELLLEGGIHVFAGLFESYKSMFALELSAALLAGRPVAGHFESHPEAVEGVVYLCLDMPHGLFLSYARNFGLDREPRFQASGPNASAFVAIDDARLREEVCGKVLVVDTMLDVARIQDAFQSAEWVEFFGKARILTESFGCKAVVLIAHPTKSGARSSAIVPSEYLKDSVTFGGKIDVAFGFRKIDNTSKVQVERIKGRGFERPIKFSLASHDEQGVSWISRGQFPVADPPEAEISLSDQLAKSPKKRPSRLTPELRSQLAECKKKKLSARETASQLGVKSHNTVTNYWKQIEEEENGGF